MAPTEGRVAKPERRWAAAAVSLIVAYFVKSYLYCYIHHVHEKTVTLYTL